MKRRRKSIFYPVFIAVLLLAVTALVVGARLYGDFLAEYEASMPKYVADPIAQTVLDGDLATAYDEYYPNADALGGEFRAAYLGRLAAYLEGRALESASVPQSDPNVKKYQLSADGDVFFTFTLRATDEKTPHGFATWAFDAASFVEFPPLEYTVTAPSWYRVTADGAELGEDARVGEDVTPNTAQYLPEGARALSFRTYAFTSHSDAPDVRATDEEGNEASVTRDGAAYVVAYIDDEALRSSMEKYVTKLAEAYTRYTNRLGGRDGLMRYVLAGSAAEEKIDGFDKDWISQPTKYDFRDMTTKNYVRYGEDRFSCDVSYTFTARYGDGSNRTFDTAYTFFYEKSAGKWYLYDFAILANP